MYAVVRTGGKQLRVAPGDVVRVELLSGEPGEQIALDDVLLVGGADGEGGLKVGQPALEGARVLATVQGERKDKKLRIFKMRRRKRYRLQKGHRQRHTVLRIDSIEV